MLAEYQMDGLQSKQILKPILICTFVIWGKKFICN